MDVVARAWTYGFVSGTSTATVLFSLLFAVLIISVEKWR